MSSLVLCVFSGLFSTRSRSALILAFDIVENLPHPTAPNGEGECYGREETSPVHRGCVGRRLVTRKPSSWLRNCAPAVRSKDD